MTLRAAARPHARRHAALPPLDTASPRQHQNHRTARARVRAIPLVVALVAGSIPATGATSWAGQDAPAASQRVAVDSPASADADASAEALLSARGAAPASRSQERVAAGAASEMTEVAPLTAVPAPPPAPVPPPPPFPAYPGCDGVATAPATNGHVPDSELCDLWQQPFRARADAAVRLVALNAAYTQAFGEPLCLASGYRTYGDQVAVKRTRGHFAATPGTSNHGWGLAVDICGSSYSGDRWNWLKARGPEFGFDNPPWARRGGDGPYEPWHWEYTEAVAGL